MAFILYYLMPDVFLPCLNKDDNDDDDDDDDDGHGTSLKFKLRNY